MRTKIKLALVTLYVSLILGTVMVSAAQTGNVYDDANLLTDSEADSIDAEITELMEETEWNIYAVTTDDAGGKSATAYADDFFDTHSALSSGGSTQEDGVVVLIDMDNREITISTCGEAIRYLTDSRLEAILDDAYEDVSDAEYAACLMTMLTGVKNAYEAGIPGGQYNYDTETGKVSRYHVITWVEVLFAVLLAAGSGAVVYAVVVGKYRMKFGAYQYDFRNNSNVMLRVNEDRFVNEMTTHRRIPRQTGSGGGSSHHSSGRSSTHRSSSGRSHGGSSRKF